jgi:hypothetical protein
MKGNMKRLSVLVGVLAMAIFVMVVMASADGPATPWGMRLPVYPHAIRGVFAVTGFSTCSPVGPGNFEADYTFNGDGTGSVTNGFVRSISWANINWENAPAAKPMVVNAGFSHYTVNFKYTVTHEGRITFEYPWGGNHIVKKDADDNLTLWELTWNLGPGHGVISPDGKTITITCGPPVVLEVVESTNPGMPVGTKASCVTTGVGIRLK